LDLLRLPTLRVLQIDEDENDIHIQVESLSPPTYCVFCQHPQLHKHEKKFQRFMDLPIRGKRVGIIIRRLRYWCCACHRTFFEPLPEMSESHAMTRRLVAYVQQQSLHRTFVSLADEVGVTEGTIRLLFGEMSLHLEPRWEELHVTALGLDELYLLHRARCVITDVGNRQIVDVLRDRKKATLLNYLHHLPESTQQHIAVVCTDMYANYHDVVRQTLPHAHLVVDKWHVLKLLSDCLDTVRKEIRETLSDSQRRTLMHDRFLLLKRPHDLDEHETLVLEAWLKNFPRLENAYRLKESFYGIYEATTEEEAILRYFTWLNQVTPEVREVFWPFAMTIEQYGDAIFAYFSHRYTAGYTESVNGLMKLLVRQSRGGSFEVIRAKALLTNGLRKPIRPSYGKSRPNAPDVICDESAHEAASIPISHSTIPANNG
jgi:transposase